MVSTAEAAGETVMAVAKSFKDLGVTDPICEACKSLKYVQPTPIQVESIPLSIEGRDIIGLAETGSGKTAAFVIPIIQRLLEKPQKLFGLILSPTRELAAQIAQVVEAIGAVVNVRAALIVGGLDMVAQQIALARGPHIVVATPGRLLDHLEKTKGFSLRKLQCLVMDEADKLLDMDFGPVLEKILKFLPRERQTYLFSATMSEKVETLQRASLQNPVRVSVVTSSYQTVSTLLQNYLLIPQMHKDTYFISLADHFAGRSMIVFTRTVRDAQRLAILLRTLGFGALALHGQLSQSARLGALKRFKEGSRDILVATDVAARGLDIPNVDVVVNYDVPSDSKTYIHRVGRTARAGRSGRALTMVNQYDYEPYLRIEHALGTKLEAYGPSREEAMVFKHRVEEAGRHAKQEMKTAMDGGRKRSSLRERRSGKDNKRAAGRADNMDAEEG